MWRLGPVWLAAAGLTIWGIVVAGPTGAQVPPSVWPRCIPERDGQQIGVGGSICECRHQWGGTMLRQPAGWRWSCDIMKMDGDHGEAMSHGPRGLPPGFVYAPQVQSRSGTAQQQQQQGGNPGTQYDQPLTGPRALFGPQRRY